MGRLFLAGGGPACLCWCVQMHFYSLGSCCFCLYAAYRTIKLVTNKSLCIFLITLIASLLCLYFLNKMFMELILSCLLSFVCFLIIFTSFYVYYLYKYPKTSYRFLFLLKNKVSSRAMRHLQNKCRI